jgi:deoxyadenosine/deoxycytidine kinase
MANVDKLKVIYLRCSPEKCHERTLKRKRPEEDEISLEYLKLIHEKHESWFSSHDLKNVLVIDTTDDEVMGCQQRVNELFTKINEFIHCD